MARMKCAGAAFSTHRRQSSTAFSIHVGTITSVAILRLIRQVIVENGKFGRLRKGSRRQATSETGEQARSSDNDIKEPSSTALQRWLL